MTIKSLCYKQQSIIMKNVSRNKFLLCFKPVVDLDQLVLDHHSKVAAVDDHSKNQGLKQRAKKEDHMKRLVSNNSSLLSDDRNNRCSTIISSSKNPLILHHHHPKKYLSRVIKAVFFEILLSKRVRDGKGNNLCQDAKIGSKHSCSSSMNRKKYLDDSSHDHDNTSLVRKVLIKSHRQAKEANLVTSCSLLSCSSSISEPRKSCKIKNSTSPNQELEFKAKTMDKAGIYLLLISLTMTILWGKLCAIFFTLIWLYFLPRRRHNTSRPENVTRSLWSPEEKEGKDQYYYKKKVIMEGLLERNHPRVNGIKFIMT